VTADPNPLLGRETCPETSTTFPARGHLEPRSVFLGVVTWFHLVVTPGQTPTHLAWPCSNDVVPGESNAWSATPSPDQRLVLQRALAAPIEPRPRPPGVHSVRLLRPPVDTGLRIVLVVPIFGARTVFFRDRGGIFQTQRVGGNDVVYECPPGRCGDSLSPHGLVGQAMAAVAQGGQVRKLIASAVLGTNKMMNGKLRGRTAMPTAVAVSLQRPCTQPLPGVLAECWS
jgi:hypothetical protein